MILWARPQIGNVSNRERETNWDGMVRQGHDLQGRRQRNSAGGWALFGCEGEARERETRLLLRWAKAEPFWGEGESDVHYEVGEKPKKIGNQVEKLREGDTLEES
jgi:hypothetical protein